LREFETNAACYKPQSFLTPNETFFVRNHGPVPVIDEKSYSLKIEGLVNNRISLSLKDLKDKFEKKEVVAALQVSLLF